MSQLTPLAYRRGIPLFCEKTPSDYARDPYERYDPTVIRQTALHLVDELWGTYPWQQALDFADAQLDLSSARDIVEVGCGVGRWIGSLARRLPLANCWGIDYSYQLLRRAQEYWIAGESVTVDYRAKGFAQIYELPGHRLTNLRLGLAKAEALPFADASQDVVLSSFLLDRLVDPLLGLREMWRVLRPGGQLVPVTPLNFQSADHWTQYYPPERLVSTLRATGFEISAVKTDMLIYEPLDAHGNYLRWKCVGLVARRGETTST
ncbi:MAG: methyltransferase domain-containing protein [Bacteroidota bacterium]